MDNVLNPGFYDEGDLRRFGIKSVGSNVRIARNCLVSGLEFISIGSNVRIDVYCTLIASSDADFTIGSYIHIGGYCHLSGGSGISIEDFSGLSQRVSIYSRSDDYSGEHMTNPMIPEKYTGVKKGMVVLGRHSIVGAGSVILPGILVGEGVSVGALSLVNKDLPAWGMYFGSPARRIGERSKNLLDLERSFLDEKARSAEVEEKPPR